MFYGVAKKKLILTLIIKTKIYFSCLYSQKAIEISWFINKIIIILFQKFH